MSDNGDQLPEPFGQDMGDHCGRYCPQQGPADQGELGQLLQGDDQLRTVGADQVDLNDVSLFFENIAREVTEGDRIEHEDLPAIQDPAIIRPTYFGTGTGDFDVAEFQLGRLLYHHVFPNSRATRNRLLDYCGRAYRQCHGRAGIIVATHEDHIHVVHGCNPTQGWCRCFRSPDTKPWKVRRHEPSRLKTRDIICLWNYLVSEQSRHLLFWSNGSEYPIAYVETGMLSICGGDVAKNGDLHEECIRAGMDRSSEDGTDDGPTSRNAGGGTKTSLGEQIREIWEVSKKEWIADVSTILNLPEVIEKFEFTLLWAMDKCEKLLENRRRLEYGKSQFWKFSDFAEALVNGNAGFGIVRHKLQSRARTFDVLLHWFETQFGDSWALTLLEIIRAFDGENGKLNTLVFVGPPSCGKTWLITMFCQIARFYGHVRNWSQGDKFCFDNLTDCRLLVHDECKFPINAPEYLESYKLLAAGQSPIVNVKFKSGTKIKPAPLFIMANQHPLSDCPSQMQYFDNVRWKVFNLIMVPDFKDLTESKYGNPLALFDLYEYALNEIQSF